MIVLGIETSCDETGVALYGDNGLLAHQLYSQAATHAAHGGVVPELASRDHVRKLIGLVRAVMAEAGISREQISAVAWTAGPGLIGALLVGASFARSLSYAWDVPGIPIHHMEGHLLAPLLEEDPPDWPFVALLVSGGHTQLYRVNGLGDYALLGESLDDAAGEAFDKTAKLLGLGYPGGPRVAQAAVQGNPDRFQFPRPMTDRPGLDFSFSGLKTFTLNTVQALQQAGDWDQQACADVARAFEEAVAATLVIKCRRALQEHGLHRLVVAGGVGANLRLREELRLACDKLGATVRYPRIEFCTDNGAMIAYAGYRHLGQGQSSDLAVRVRPRWPLGEALA